MRAARLPRRTAAKPPVLVLGGNPLTLVTAWEEMAWREKVATKRLAKSESWWANPLELGSLSCYHSVVATDRSCPVGTNERNRLLFRRGTGLFERCNRYSILQSEGRPVLPRPFIQGRHGENGDSKKVRQSLPNFGVVPSQIWPLTTSTVTSSSTVRCTVAGCLLSNGQKPGEPHFFRP
jgi:hypothetical protein